MSDTPARTLSLKDLNLSANDLADIENYHPKGPFPLFSSDLINDTLGWSDAERWCYTRLLEYLFRHGGFIEDDHRLISEAMGLRRVMRGHKGVLKVREKLSAVSEYKPDCVTQKRILCDIVKTFRRSELGKKAVASRYNGTATEVHTEGLPPRKASVSPPSLTPSLKEDSKKTNQKKGVEIINPDFDKFWKAYPHKPGNSEKPARQKFELAVKRGVSPDKIISVAEQYAEFVKTEYSDPKYYAAPVVWLNQERWNDDYKPKKETESIAHDPGSPEQAAARKLFYGDQADLLGASND